MSTGHLHAVAGAIFFALTPIRLFHDDPLKDFIFSG